ncbi:MAG TPA: glycosyltransferase, partial [Anaerolineae bacterium]|nr:glycosyltransferase [Anaerolineae bacterium]
GGSIDGTVSVLNNYGATSNLPIRVITAAGANISQGRNIAIKAAVQPIIASTDAGVRLDPGWLEGLTRPFQAERPPAVVSGFFMPDPQTVFERSMGATVLPRLEEINPATFLPSSRSIAFLKSSWQKVGGYPEWLDFCEDLIFDFRLRDEIGSFAFAPGALVYFRPRSNLRTFFKQYYQYARGDGKADLWRKRHAIRYFTYLIALPLILILGFWVSPWWWLFGLTVGAIGLFYTPYKRLLASWQKLSLLEKLQAAAWVPIIRVTGDVAKMLGYPAGWRWRLAHLAAQPELKWRS